MNAKSVVVLSLVVIIGLGIVAYVGLGQLTHTSPTSTSNSSHVSTTSSTITEVLTSSTFGVLPCNQTSSSSASSTQLSGNILFVLNGELSYNGTHNSLRYMLSVTNGMPSPIAFSFYQLVLVNETLLNHATASIGQQVIANGNVSIQSGETCCYPTLTLHWRTLSGNMPQMACSLLTLLRDHQTGPTTGEANHYFTFKAVGSQSNGC
jgi:hypothetical protein